MGRFSFVVVALLLAVNIAHHGALSNPIKKQKSVRLGRIEVSKHSDTCAVDLRGETYNGVCTTIKNCDLNVIDKDSVARNAGVAYKSAKCHAGKSCCADVLCIGGHGHCLDARTHKCAFATIGGQCLGGSTVKCCPLQESGLEDWQKEKFESHPRCLGGRGVCRPRRGAAGSSFPCKHGWVGGQCGKGANYCCPFSKNSKKEWENEKLQRKCDFIAPIAKELDLSIDILMAFEAVESGGTPNAIRFECHKFNQRARKQKFKKVSCTIKSGDSFSRVRAESGSQAFKTAYAINQKGAAYLAAAAQINPTGQLEETGGLARNRFDARMNGTAVERAVESAMPNNAVTLTQQQAVAGITGGFATELAVDPNLHNRTT